MSTRYRVSLSARQIHALASVLAYAERRIDEEADVDDGDVRFFLDGLRSKLDEAQAAFDFAFAQAALRGIPV